MNLLGLGDWNVMDRDWKTLKLLQGECNMLAFIIVYFSPLFVKPGYSSKEVFLL